MQALRIGVIGCGGRGHLAWHAHDPRHNVRLVAGADVSDRALAEFKDKFGPDVFVTRDYRRLLRRDDIDAVFITSPDFLHETMAVAALSSKKHVYLEKPMAITIKGCDRILRTAAANKVKVYVGHNMRHMTVIQKMKELIDQGTIGEVKAGWCRHFVAYGGDAYFKDWHAERSKSTSLLLQKGAHDIDVLHWLCGGYSKRVTAVGNLSVYNKIKSRHKKSERGDASWSHANWPPSSLKGLNPIIDVEDLSMMLMELDNGVLCSYQQCHYAPDGWRNYTIIGDAGRIENFDTEPDTIRVWDKRCHFKEKGDWQVVCRPPKGGHGGADPQIVGEFIRYIRKGGTTLTSPIAARMSVAAGCLAAASLRNGSKPYAIPPLEPRLRKYFKG